MKRIRKGQFDGEIKEKAMLIMVVCLALVVCVIIFKNKDDYFKAFKNIYVMVPEKTEVIAEGIRVGITEEEDEQLGKVVVKSEIIEERFAEVGKLVTEEYYFTQVESYTKEKKLLNVFPADSHVTFSYDGVVRAGVNFSELKVTVDESNNEINVIMPKAYIMGVDLDYDSFNLYEEKERIWNKLEYRDYSESITRFKGDARRKAMANGIVTKANENAEAIIRNMITCIVGNDYQIKFEKETN